MATVELLTSPGSSISSTESMGSSYRPTTPGLSKQGLQVSETSRSVRVETDRPHLVSLGGGRLSTAVTIHPLPEGKTNVGTLDAPVRQDIIVEGAAIEDEHCVIENIDNVVTIYPIAPSVSLDGMRITGPTRLSQGSMICLGRSTFFRFNHPQEAKLIKQILPGAHVSVPAAFMPAIGEGYTAQNKMPLESSDFVEKVSKFEYLAHSRSPPVTSQETQKWFVHEGLRIPTSPPPIPPQELTNGTLEDLLVKMSSPNFERKTKSLASDRSPISQRIKKMQTGNLGSRTPEPQSVRRSPVLFWSGRCTPTSPHLHGSLCNSEEDLKACEDELKLKHRKARLERLRDEEQERLEKQRLEEIINMCAEYERQSEKTRQIQAETRAELATYSSFPTGMPPNSIHRSTSNSHQHQQQQQHNSQNNIGYYSSLSHHNMPHNRIKTNGSLPRDRLPSSLPGTFTDNVEGATLIMNPKALIQPASSEDELNEILNVEKQNNEDEDLSPTSPNLTEANLYQCNSPTSVQLRNESKVYENQHAVSEYNNSRKQILVTADIELAPKELRKEILSKQARETVIGSPEKLKLTPEKHEELRQLCRWKIECVRKISTIKQAVANIEAQESEQLRELEMELALVAGEEKEESQLLLEDIKQFEELQTRERRFVEQAEKEKLEEQEQLESAKQQLLEREENVKRLKEKIDSKTGEDEGEEKKELEESYKRELELMEAEKKAFEDLEFQQLESQTHRDEERESLMQAISDIPLAIQERKDRMAELVEQQKVINEQVEQEHRIFNSKKNHMSKTLYEMQVRLDSLELMIRQRTNYVDNFKNPESSPESSPRSLRNKILNRKDVRNDCWRDLRDEGCQSFHSVDSESSSIMSSDIPVDSSSEDRSRPTSLQKDGSTSAASKDSGPVSTPNSEDTSFYEVRNRDHLLSLQDDLSLIDSQKPTTTTEVIRRDKQRAQRPLTRYLPIRSQEFDLRQHVESAGHQIELCHFVRVDATTCRGYLHKLGGKWHTWKKRWFLFDRVKRALIYFNDKSENKLRGGISFQAIEEVYVDHAHSVKSHNPQATFCMKTFERVYHLMAPSPEAMRIWVDVIFTGAEGYLEFLTEDQ